MSRKKQTLLLSLLLASCGYDFRSLCKKYDNFFTSKCDVKDNSDWFDLPVGMSPVGLGTTQAGAIALRAAPDQPDVKLLADLNELTAKAQSPTNTVTIRQPDKYDEIAIDLLFGYEFRNQPQSCVLSAKQPDFSALLHEPAANGGLKYLKLGPSFAFNYELTKNFSSKFTAQFRVEAEAQLKLLKQAQINVVMDAVAELATSAQSKSVTIGVLRYVVPQNPVEFRERLAELASEHCRNNGEGRTLTDGLVYVAIGKLENASIKGSSSSFESELEAKLKGLELDIGIVELKLAARAALKFAIKSEINISETSYLEGGALIPLRTRRDLYFTPQQH